MDASRMEAADKAKQQPATAKPEGEAAAAPAGDVDLTRERIDKAEWDAMSPLARSRINAFRGKIKEYGGLLHDMAPKAKTFDDLNGWMGSVRMTQDEFVNGLQIMALMKTDPAKAWQALQPVIADLRSRIGEELPEDLAKAVEEGTINEESARRLSRETRERMRLQEQMRERESVEEQTRAANAEAAVHDSIRRSIESWEGNWKATDPDYPKKAERVWEAMFSVMEAERRAGKPITNARVLEIAKAARTKVEAWMTGLVPPAREKTPVAGNGNAANASRQPSSALEAARMALGR